MKEKMQRSQSFPTATQDISRIRRSRTLSSTIDRTTDSPTSPCNMSGVVEEVSVMLLPLISPTPSVNESWIGTGGRCRYCQQQSDSAHEENIVSYRLSLSSVSDDRNNLKQPEKKQTKSCEIVPLPSDLGNVDHDTMDVSYKFSTSNDRNYRRKKKRSKSYEIVTLPDDKSTDISDLAISAGHNTLAGTLDYPYNTDIHPLGYKYRLDEPPTCELANYCSWAVRTGFRGLCCTVQVS